VNHRRILACLLALNLAGLLAAQRDKPDTTAEKTITNSIGMKLVHIPAGKFQMGSPAREAERDDIEVQHAVEISKPFYMGAYEVTQAQYSKIMGPSRAESGKQNSNNFGSRFDAKHGGGPDHPAENVRWYQAGQFCTNLSALPEEKKAGRVYRLPTEAEWEYACRAGTTTPSHYGDSLSSKQANCNGNYPYGGADKGPYLRRTTRVGSYKPNAWGLYDMHGNVWEWCSDWYDPDYYKKSPRKDPQGPDKGVIGTGYKEWNVPGVGQYYRVMRGGSWVDEGRGCRSAYRFRGMPHDGYQIVGFRVVCQVTGK
jgi:formylglycine-generating enzyme required for sulfatase activity